MVARYYPAVVDRSAGGFGITFPDFPGCVSAGSTLEETLERGHQALAAHVELTIEHGEPIPEPSPLDEIVADLDEEVVLKTLIRVDLPGRAVRLSITMDEALAQAVDRTAAAEGFTRSGFLAEAARRLLRERAGAWAEPTDRAGARLSSRGAAPRSPRRSA
jgi:predicted RNase H-like HicB family nuclease